MKKVIIRISFSNGDIGYYKSRECVTSDRDMAKIFDKKYAEGLAEGIRFCIKVYGDDLVTKVEVEDK